MIEGRRSDVGEMTIRDLLVEVIRGLISLAALAGATYLAAHRVVDGQAVVVLYTAVISLYGASAVRASDRRRDSVNGG